MLAKFLNFHGEIHLLRAGAGAMGGGSGMRKGAQMAWAGDPVGLPRVASMTMVGLAHLDRQDPQLCDVCAYNIYIYNIMYVYYVCIEVMSQAPSFRWIQFSCFNFEDLLLPQKTLAISRWKFRKQHFTSCFMHAMELGTLKITGISDGDLPAQSFQNRNF